MALSRRSPARRRIALLALLVVLIGAAVVLWPRDTAEAPAAQGGATLTDVKGRTMRVGAAKRIAIDDSRYLVALGLIHPDPVSLLAAWPNDVNRLGPETYQQFLKQAPGLAQLPKIASSAQPFDTEALLAAKPDVALLSLESGVTDAQIAQVEAAGIPVVVLDFFTDPFANLEKSMTLLGRLTGREAAARDFVRFRAERLARIAARVRSLPADQRPPVFLEAHAGMSQDCCSAPGQGSIGQAIAFVGGHNIGADVIKQASGKLNPEYIISRNPAVYIATGGPHLKKAGGFVLGADVSEEQARASLAKVAARPAIAGLSAVRDGRAYGFSHQLINSPLDVVAVEAFARWIHPELFADLDPAAMLAALNRRSAAPYTGTLWVALKPSR
jgi:iron complex transport system substrate-binding protein